MTAIPGGQPKGVFVSGRGLLQMAKAEKFPVCQFWSVAWADTRGRDLLHECAVNNALNYDFL